MTPAGQARLVPVDGHTRRVSLTRHSTARGGRPQRVDHSAARPLIGVARPANAYCHGDTSVNNIAYDKQSFFFDKLLENPMLGSLTACRRKMTSVYLLFYYKRTTQKTRSNRTQRPEVKHSPVKLHQST